MQTFVPLGTDFQGTAKVLDRQRLGKQRVEGLQILNALTGRSKGWVNHPAVKMWKGYEPALIQYVVAMCDEWVSRGYKDTCRDKVLSIGKALPSAVTNPPWLDDPEVQLSHRSNLVRKLPEHYGEIWEVPNDLPYKWVV
jgi:hypothetical protein